MINIFYDHIYGNTTKYDIIYGLALAEVDPGEEEIALNLGWTPMDAFFYTTDKQLWIQARTTRIDLTKFSVKRKHKRYLNQKIIGEYYRDLNPYSDECNSVFQKYCEYKGYDDHSSELVDKEYGPKDYFVYWYEDQVIGYTQLTHYDYSVVAGEFAWDYQMPELGLGTFAQNFECLKYQELDFKYYYSSYAYEKVCEYKSFYNGFEWWTGRIWNKDKQLYKELIDKDSKVKSLEDLYRLHKDYYRRVYSSPERYA